MTSGIDASVAGQVNLPGEPTGHVRGPHGDVAYWRAGVPTRRSPLLCLHGGPGMPHAYLDPLARLATEREVVFYDQSGSGRSARPRPGRPWTIADFVAELAAVLDALGWTRFHVFGNSWGGWLALEYVLGGAPLRPSGLVLSSCTPSVEGWVSGVRELRAGLPADAVAALDRHEAAGTTESDEYRAALRQFNRRHLCRSRPWPASLKAAIAGFGDDVYTDLWGESEFGPVTGALRGWDATARLAEVTVPVLVTGGQHDEARPDQLRRLAEGIPGARLRLFEESSHVAFLEEEDAYLTAVASFLREVDDEETR